MESTRFSLLVVVLGLLHLVNGTLYGIVAGGAGEGTQTALYTVVVDPKSGNLTEIARNIFYVGSSATVDGVATFDQDNQILYFSTDFANSFVFGVDVTSGQIIPPISVAASYISSVAWDSVNSQLLITGSFDDNTQALISFPDSGPSLEVLNYTTEGYDIYPPATVDQAKGIYYFAYFDDDTQVYNVGSFALGVADPDVSTYSLDCGNDPAAFSPYSFFFDSDEAKLLGFGYNTTTSEYVYFEAVSGACDVYPLGLKGVITCAAYDPTDGTLYLGYTENDSVLIIYDTLANTFTQVTTPALLTDLEVSYKL